MPKEAHIQLRDNAIVTGYWMEHYSTEHCTVCGNRGVIDSTGVRTPNGKLVGRMNWCFCPNGQALRENSDGQLPQ